MPHQQITRIGSNPNIGQLVHLVSRLHATEKIDLVKIIMTDLQSEYQSLSGKRPLETACGICKHFGSAPSEEDIAMMRKEVFEGFPRGEL